MSAHARERALFQRPVEAAQGAVERLAAGVVQEEVCGEVDVEEELTDLLPEQRRARKLVVRVAHVDARDVDPKHVRRKVERDERARHEQQEARSAQLQGLPDVERQPDDAAAAAASVSAGAGLVARAQRGGARRAAVAARCRRRPVDDVFEGPAPLFAAHSDVGDGEAGGGRRGPVGAGGEHRQVQPAAAPPPPVEEIDDANRYGRVAEDDRQRRKDHGDDRVDVVEDLRRVAVPGQRHADAGAARQRHDAGGEEREGVEEGGADRQRTEDGARAPPRAHAVLLQRVEDDHVALEREADDRPDGQEAVDGRRVDEELAPAVVAERVDAEVAEPDGRQRAEEGGVDDGEELEVDARRLEAQVGAGERDDRQRVADDADDDDERDAEHVHHVDGRLQQHVAGRQWRRAR